MSESTNTTLSDLRKSYGTYLDFLSYGEKYAIFTNILIVTVSRITFTKNRNLRKFLRHFYLKMALRNS